MFEAEGRARPPYAALFERLQRADLHDMQQRQATADQAFLNRGITFTVTGSPKDRADLSVRPHPAGHHHDGWARLERGLTQRLTALDLFLEDLYTDARLVLQSLRDVACRERTGRSHPPQPRASSAFAEELRPNLFLPKSIFAGAA